MSAPSARCCCFCFCRCSLGTGAPLKLDHVRPLRARAY